VQCRIKIMLTSSESEAWLRGVVSRLRISAERSGSKFEAENLLALARKFMPRKLTEAMKHQDSWDINDPDDFLDRIFKVDQMISLEDIAGNFHRVAIDITLTSNEEIISSKLSQIDSHAFRQMRRALEIDNHWILVLSNSNAMPSDGDISDLFYKKVDEGSECQVMRI
jgi:hypothetical protein